MFLRAKQSRSVRQILLAMAMGLAMVAIAWLVLSCAPNPSPTDTPVPIPTFTPAPTPPGLSFVDDNHKPIRTDDRMTESVRVLCYASLASSDLLADVIRETNEQGVPTPDLPAGCNYVAALHLKYEQPSGWPNHGPAYWVYATSWEPGATTPLRAAGDILISDQWPLVVFNVVASLAWEPSPGSDPVVKDLEIGLRDASAYLYDVTDGRMAFGPIEIYSGGQNWNGADLRFLAANDYRPSAYVGGMVGKRIHYNTSPVTAVVFSPGPVYLGRDWSRHGASDTSSRPWYEEDAYHTIIHEWAHYALFLYDEYQDIEGSGASRAYCTCKELSAAGGRCLEPKYGQEKEASVMAWQYQASELWHPGVPPPASGANLCKKTEQFQIYSQSDWETLEAWYEIQGLSGLPSLAGPASFSDLNAGPALGLANNLFGRMPGGNVTLPSSSSGGTPTALPPQPIRIEISGGLGITETPASEVYLLKGPPGAPKRILHEGKAAGPSHSASGFLGTTHVLGADGGDQLGIFVDRQETGKLPNGGRYTFIGTLPGPGGTATAKLDEWHASLDITPILDGSLLTGIKVILTSHSHPNLDPPPTVQLCIPDAAIGCDQEITMNQVNTTTWTQTITHSGSDAELPRYGVLRVRAKGVGEIIRWFQDGGGVPPAHDDGGSPVADGLLKVHINGTLPNSSLCNRVIFMPAASYEALTRSLGEAQKDPEYPEQEVRDQGVLEVPLDIDFMLPVNGKCTSLGPGDTLPVPVTLTMFYNQETIERLKGQELSIDEGNLRILHYDRRTNQWSEVGVASRDPELDWIATEPVREAGIYAIVWVAS
jgi:hypothetical protein